MKNISDFGILNHSSFSFYTFFCKNNFHF